MPAAIRAKGADTDAKEVSKSETTEGAEAVDGGKRVAGEEVTALLVRRERGDRHATFGTVEIKGRRRAARPTSGLGIRQPNRVCAQGPGHPDHEEGVVLRWREGDEGRLPVNDPVGMH